jgi:uncharacterized iron-regulated membrane protein
MKRDRSRALLGIHGRLGLLLGLVLYIVAISGVMSLFVRYLPSWEDERLRVPMPAAHDTGTDIGAGAVDPVLALLRRARPDIWKTLPIVAHEGQPGDPRESVHDILHILLPSPLLPVHTVWWVDEEHGVREFYVDLQAARVLDERPQRLTDFVRGLHTDLLLPTPYGRYLVGLLGVVFLLLIITGFWFHARKAPEHLHTFRVEHGARTMWSDLHKVIGVWALLFHAAMAATGALLGLLGLITIVVALAATRGDQAKAIAAVVTQPPVRSGAAAPMIPIDAMLRQTHAVWPGFVPEGVALHAWGDRAATLEVTGLERGRLATGGAIGQSLWFHGETGNVTRRVDLSRGSLAQRIYAAITPLHYATISGLPLRVLYAILGLSTTLLAVSGLWIWIEGQRRRTMSAGEAVTASRLERFTIGTVFGVPGALAAAAIVARVWTAPAMDATRLPIVAGGVWLACLLLAWIARDAHTAARRVAWTCALLFCLVPIADTIATGTTILSAWRDGLHAVLVVDAGTLLAGLTGIVAARRLGRAPERAVAAGQARADDPAVAGS